MATGKTGFDDVGYDLVSVQHHPLKAGHDCGQYVRDTGNADRQDTADFFRRVTDEDSAREAVPRVLRGPDRRWRARPGPHVKG